MIARAASILRAGGIVAFPTETVYGLGANALDADAIGRIYRIKQRPATSPLIVHVNSVDMARALASRWPEEAEKLAAAFWPGPLTLVLEKTAAVPGALTAGLDTVGLRMPAHPMALDLIAAANLPVAAPSANRFTQLSPTTAKHVSDALGDAVDMILDGGPTRVGIESTVLSLAGGTARLLRPGMISRQQIEEVIGPILIASAAAGAHESPGQHDKHYSPRTPLYVIEEARPLPNGSGIYLYHSQPRKGATPRQLPADAAGYAAVLYSALHQCDLEGWAYIAVEPLPALPEWAGVEDRLRRASVR